MDLAPGLRSQVDRTVTDDDTATALGSGDVPVLGTPRLVAWAEAATVAALDGHLDDGATSVGARVEFEHRAASGVGSLVTASAELVAVDGVHLHFSVVATEGGRTVGTGEIVRVLVDRARFLERVAPT